ncbi:lipid-A-disaccharide synthase [Nitratireductor pacificus]|uniref:Lipid-A-disaccharide synthase n=1 Tax=Nitratireductor pacificus pht-3B TaxID=391937 RepID=K2MFN4_9HYPH|nr:lipid-A-disaccharide synthase [Nitratireductor pacificus]EKF19525.1 lipid-A-disaccharide synthase [Nitratireductor pacificus pht-3B]
MSAVSRPLQLAIIAGEESGDLLGADLVAALSASAGTPVALTGVGGRGLQALGLEPLFDADDIALMGISAILRDLPRLVARIGQTARAIVAAKPDCLVTIDSPEFSLRVAKKVRAMAPDIPIIHYVCPSVWAWRPGRAPAMRPHVDEILCLLPFEPDELRRLDGPPGTFVGHRLATDPDIRAAAQAHLKNGKPAKTLTRNLLMLPGSRKGEVSRLMEPFGKTARHLAEAGHDFRILIPTVPHVAGMVEEASRQWQVRPEIILDAERKWQAFAAADAALACSGTVSLELALARVPSVICYKTDFVARALIPLISVWSAALPNLIAGWPVVPEHFNQFVRPNYLARQIAQLWDDTPLRAAQMAGFAAVAQALETPRPSGALAAEVVLRHIAQRR